jgi:hypothetical protein
MHIRNLKPISTPNNGVYKAEVVLQCQESPKCGSTNLKPEAIIQKRTSTAILSASEKTSEADIHE